MDQMMQPGAGKASKPEGKTVFITAAPDGTYHVGDHDAYMAQHEGAQDEMIDEGAAMGAMPEKSTMTPAMTPTASIDEAMDLARQMLQDDGQSPEAQMMSGYKAAARPAPKNPTPSQVFGE